MGKRTRRDFLRSAAIASGGVLAAGTTNASAASTPARKPNILMICSDQFRADFVHANGQNPSAVTPNIDALAARGTNFCQAVSNQPLCSPARSVFLTGMTATKTTVWKLDASMEIDHSLPTIASVLKGAGYNTHFVGKWHVSHESKEHGMGWVAPGPSRYGFDTWEGANIPELTSHPTYGNYWTDDGTNIGFKDVYRADFFTDRAMKVLEQQSHDKPWLLFLSQAEPHQQNDIDMMVPPERYANNYADPFIPQDLRNRPGNWRSRIGGYYGCVQAIDDCVGKMVATLEKLGQLDNTVIVFFSDHGCTFRTRLGEYKRNPADAAIRIPMIFAGPGFDHATRLDEVVSLLDLTPTLIDAAGIQVPQSMQGKSLKPLASDPIARKAWDNTAYIQISASMCGRAIRTKDWMFSIYDPDARPNGDSIGKKYIDFAMYQVGADPYQYTNLVGRPEYKHEADKLREELRRRVIGNGEPDPHIVAQHYYV